MTKANTPHGHSGHQSEDPVTTDLAQLQNEFSDLRKDVRKLLGTARSLPGDLKDHGVERLEEKLREKPILSAAVALLIGFVAAKIFSRR
jgi:hypothetical protein